MRYFRTVDGEVRAIAEDQTDLIQAEWIELSEEEIAVLFNPPKTEAEQKDHFKSLYLSVLRAKLDELDYDGIDTVTMWANKSGSAFQTEAQAILNWYEAIITTNYVILNAVKAGTRPVPTDAEYLAELPVFA